MTPIVVYTSKTGNTAIVAHAVADHFEAPCFKACSAPENTDGFDTVILGFWNDAGRISEELKSFASRLSGKKIVCFATIGGDPQSPHAAEWMEATSTALVQAGSGNTLAATFMCRGRIDPELVKRMDAMGGASSSPERRANREKSNTHPDRIDIENAVTAISEALI